MQASQSDELGSGAIWKEEEDPLEMEKAGWWSSLAFKGMIITATIAGWLFVGRVTRRWAELASLIWSDSSM